MGSDNHPLEKETHLSMFFFLGSVLVFPGVPSFEPISWQNLSLQTSWLKIVDTKNV